jgi:aryl-alcohol dehydrogenase-like predicted oxidoreductase
MARGFLCGKPRRTGSPTIRVETDDFAEKIYGREADVAVAEAVEAVATARGVEPGQVALAWTLSRPGVDAPIFGPTRAGHVDAAIAAMEIVLEADEVRRIDAAYLPRPAAGHGI